MTNNNYNAGYIKGICIFCAILTVVFFLFRAFDFIDWAWVWVFSPIWIPIGLAICVFVVMIVTSLIISAIELHKGK